jgi:hypothetical protein
MVSVRPSNCKYNLTSEAGTVKFFENINLGSAALECLH